MSFSLSQPGKGGKTTYTCSQMLQKLSVLRIKHGNIQTSNLNKQSLHQFIDPFSCYNGKYNKEYLQIICKLKANWIPRVGQAKIQRPRHGCILLDFGGPGDIFFSHFKLTLRCNNNALHEPQRNQLRTDPTLILRGKWDSSWYYPALLLIYYQTEFISLFIICLTLFLQNIQSASGMKKITFGTRELNKLLDDTLMSKYTFSSETLMEIAGIAVAQVSDLILKKIHQQKVCVLVGPGNNGGDGLVAARHLKMMNYSVNIVVFKQLQGKNGNFLKLCELNDIKAKMAGKDFGEPSSEQAQKNFLSYLSDHHLIIDGIFGFPFTGEIRAPYKYFLPSLKPFEERILSIDIPSGWDANQGNIHNLFTPKYMISLGIPKKCSQQFKGQHYLGGRFIPQQIMKQLQLTLPDYQGTSLYMKL